MPKLYEEAILHHQAGHLDQAVSHYRRILEIDPEHADALHFLGIIALQREGPEAALPLITRAIERNPGAALYHTNLALAHRAAGNLEEAAASLRKSLELNPLGVEALSIMAAVLALQGNLEEAADMFRKLLSVRPDSAEVHNNLAQILTASGDADEAEEHYRSAIRCNPENPDPIRNYVQFLIQRERWRAAADACQRLRELLPDDEDVEKTLTMCREKAGLENS